MSTSSPGAATTEFLQVLQQAIAHPQSLLTMVEPFLARDADSCIPHLIQVFDTTEMAAKRAIADVFLGPLRARAAGSLLPYLSQGNVDRYFWAAEVLGEMLEPQALPLLIKGLSGTHKSVVIASVKGVARYRTEDAFASLIKFFSTCRDEVFLSASLRFLVPLKEDLVPRLLPTFSAQDRFRKAWLLKYFAETGASQALQLFSTTLKKEPNDFGLFCIEGLGNIGSSEAAQIIGKELDNPEWFIRKRLVVALGRCGCPDSVPYLISALADESVQVRASAIEGLSQVGRHDIPRMVKELESTTSRERRIGLIRALGAMKDRSVLTPIIKTLTDRSTLFVSLDVLGDLGFPEAADSLTPFLRDPEWFNRLNAIEALGKLPLPNLKTIVESCREDANDMVRNAVARILSRTEEHDGHTVA